MERVSRGHRLRDLSTRALRTSSGRGHRDDGSPSGVDTRASGGGGSADETRAHRTGVRQPGPGHPSQNARPQSTHHDGSPHETASADRDPRAASGPGRPNPRPHPGYSHYPPDGASTPRPAPGDSGAGTGAGGTGGADAYRTPPTHNPHLPPLNADTTDRTTAYADEERRSGPAKLTVTRVAAHRTRQFTRRVFGLIHSAATADGADESGLTALLRPVVLNYAIDAAMAVALANTLFFAAASGESKGKVGLYLLLTIAPFAIIAPVIGPLLDRIQRGRRIAMATTFAVRALLAAVVIANSGWDPVSRQLTYDPWVLYPAALGLLVMSKSFGVLKSAVTPRVLPEGIDLVRVNSRLTTFGLVGGTIVGGAIATIFEFFLGKLLPWHFPGAMLWLAVAAIIAGICCLRIPAWVESTEGEVPTTLTYHGEPAIHQDFDGQQSRTRKRKFSRAALTKHLRQPLGRGVVTGLWGNGTIRILTGFLTIYIAFYAKSNEHQSGWVQLAMVGAVGAAAGIGNFIGNAAGTRLDLPQPSRIVLATTTAAVLGAIATAVFGNLLVAVIATLIASGTSAIAKVSLDSSIQDDLPEESRASAFGRSETVLQLAWVLGAALGVLLPPNLRIGFGVVAVVMVLGFTQTVLTHRGGTLVPGLGGKRPEQAAPSGAIPVPDGDRATDQYR